MKCDGEVLVWAAAALGYTISLEELERLAAAAQELDPDEMNAAGGCLIVVWKKKAMNSFA